MEPLNAGVRLRDMNVGVFTRAELLRTGETDSSLRRYVREGRLSRLRAGWYATGTANPAAVEAVRRGGVLSCVSALTVHGFWVAPGYPNVHVRGLRDNRHAEFCRHRGRPLPTRAAVDSVATALACAADCMRGEDWIAAADSVLNKKGMETEDLRQALEGLISPPVHRLLDKCDPRSESGTESLARVRLRASGYAVEVQPRICGRRRDLRIGRLIIECDSKAHHTSPANYELDRQRDRETLLAGYATMRLTYSTIIYNWDRALDDIQAFTRAARHRYGGNAAEIRTMPSHRRDNHADRS